MINRIFLLALVVTLVAGCQSSGNNKDAQEDKEETGNKVQVKKYYNEGKLVKEVTFENDIRNGICRNYYDDGRLITRRVKYTVQLPIKTIRYMGYRLNITRQAGFRPLSHMKTVSGYRA